MSILYCIMIIAFFMLILTLYGMWQLYLAKYRPQSSYYWRHFPRGSMVILYVTQHPFIDCIMGALRVLVTTHFIACRRLSVYKHLWVFIRIKHRFRTIPHQEPARLLSIIEPMMVPNRMTQIEFEGFERLIMIRFEQLQATQLTPTSLRTSMAETHLEIAGIFRALLLHCVQQDRRIMVAIKRSNSLTYKALCEIYPYAIQTGQLLQILHDLFHFRRDLWLENNTAQISANYFLAQLEANDLFKKNLPLLHELPQRSINFYELPIDIRTIFIQTQRHFSTVAFGLNVWIGFVYGLSWEYQYRIGFPNYKRL